MPELPDLQVFSRNLDKRFAGKKLKRIDLFNSKKLNTPPAKLKKSLHGQVLVKVKREGKQLYFHFKNKEVLGMHLMLKGKLQIFEGPNPGKHKIVDLVFDNGTGLSLSDFMGAAHITLDPGEPEAPDALSDEVSAPFLITKLSEAKGSIKSFLLEQRNIRGIGNAYADEILYDARISPLSICSKIPGPAIRRLAKSIKTVLKAAEKQIIKANPDIISGEIRDFLKVHTRLKTHTPTGGLIQHKQIKSRKTYFTDEQELFD